MKKALVLLAIIVTEAVVLVAPTFLPPAKAQATVSIPELVLTIIAGNGTTLTFSPATVLVPQVPIVLNITVINRGTVGLHTFTIRDTSGTPQVNLQLPATNSSATVVFQVNRTGNGLGAIFYNGTSFTPERAGTGIRFFCIPHEQVGMVGQIVLATLASALTEEKGTFLRAYWIGIIALGAMVAWTGITYLLIKTSSRRFTDHRDHIRRGLP